MWTQLPFGEGLRAALGPPRGPRRLESSPRSRVWRVELAGTPAVVKQLVAGPGAEERYAREVAALRIASRAEPAVVPALLGTDPGERVLVLAHVDHRPPPREWIVGYAKALARLHATGVPADAGLLPAWSGPTQGDADSFLHLAETLGVTVAPGVPAELTALVGRLDRAGGHALLHGDPCPGNDLHTRGGVTFIDFEQASLGNGLTELAYVRIGFPTCWCVTKAAPALLDRAETAYRTTWKALTGTDPEADLTDACAGWLLRGDALVERARRGTVDHLARIPDHDWTWGTVSARQRLAHRLGVVAGMTADRPGLRGLHTVSTDLRRAMAARWPSLGPVPADRP
ncbi:aminoglycoside phosphotransferase family protein [Streptomyces liangshanensis]|uniref:Aminoglycoside phosphotransferase family protein n=1 Tax=Streptomyces liangshanensis TaxID=2717324 RepID=A0A6G9H6T7_9ACTN|nr:aminoglycoside phosphotransferase family protein [Streptomyces liangshanensis]QIQ06262.1 aminoglycoside phosphotransferase family protein [Streptomyces liangshanensis]